MSKKRCSYEELSLVPYFIANSVCGTVYTGHECKNLSAEHILEIESARKLMDSKKISEFCEQVNNRCRQAYEAKSEWFEKCVNAKGDSGRDQLSIWIIHWLAAYLKKEKFQTC